MSLDSESENYAELTWDMRQFNIRINSDANLFYMFWQHFQHVLELQNGLGAHNRCHTGVDEKKQITRLVHPVSYLSPN